MKLFLTNIYRTGRYYVRSFAGRINLIRNKNILAQSKGNWVILLSLGRKGPAPNVAKQLWERGYRVHVLSPEFPSRERAHMHSWQKVSGLDKIKSTDKLSTLIASLEKKKPVGVLLEAKNLLLPAQVAIAEALGVKSVGQKAVETSNSKIAMHQALDQLGGRQWPWEEITNLSNVQLEFPAVVKPDRGTASKGVILLQKKDDLALVVEKNKELKDDISVGERWLVESFVKGRQFDLEGIAQDGKFKFYVCAEEYYEGREPYFPPAWHYLNPPISADLQEVLDEGARQALQALGVRNGAFHIEMRIDSNGNTFALDYANRMGYNDLVTRAAGTSFPGGYIDTMLNRVALHDITFDKTPVFNLFCQDNETMTMANRFRQKYPDCVIRYSTAAFQIGHTQFQGRITVTDKDDSSLYQKLASVDGVPEQFARFYPELADNRLVSSVGR